MANNQRDGFDPTRNWGNQQQYRGFTYKPQDSPSGFYNNNQGSFNHLGTDFLIDERDPHQRDVNQNTPRANPPFVANHENSMGHSDFNYKLDSRENSHENNFFGVQIKTAFMEKRQESGFSSHFNEPPVRGIYEARIQEQPNNTYQQQQQSEKDIREYGNQMHPMQYYNHQHIVPLKNYDQVLSLEQIQLMESDFHKKQKKQAKQRELRQFKMNQLIFPQKPDEPAEEEEEMDLSIMQQRKKVSTDSHLIEDEAQSDNSIIKENTPQPPQDGFNSSQSEESESSSDSSSSSQSEHKFKSLRIKFDLDHVPELKQMVSISLEVVSPELPEEGPPTPMEKTPTHKELTVVSIPLNDEFKIPLKQEKPAAPEEIECPLRIPNYEVSNLSSQNENSLSESFDSTRAKLGKVIKKKKVQSFKISINMKEKQAIFQVPLPEIKQLLNPPEVRKTQMISINFKKDESQYNNLINQKVLKDQILMDSISKNPEQIMESKNAKFQIPLAETIQSRQSIFQTPHNMPPIVQAVPRVKIPEKTIPSDQKQGQNNHKYQPYIKIENYIKSDLTLNIHMNGDQMVQEISASNQASAEASSNNANMNSSARSQISQILQYLLSNREPQRLAILSNKAEQQNSEMGDYSLSIKDRSLSENGYKKAKKRKQPLQMVFETQRIEHQETQIPQIQEQKIPEQESHKAQEEFQNPEETLPEETLPVEKLSKLDVQEVVVSTPKGKGRGRGKKAAIIDAASNIFKLGNLSEITSPSKRSGRGRPPRYNQTRSQFCGFQDMHQRIELGFQEHCIRNIEPIIPITFVKRDYTPNTNLIRGLPVIQYMIQLLEITTQTSHQISGILISELTPITLDSYSDLLNQLLLLDMFDIKNVTIQESGLKEDAQNVIQEIIQGIQTNLQFLILISRNNARDEQEYLKESNRKLIYCIQTYFHMYDFLFDELNKLWDTEPIQQSELIKQIKQIRRLVGINLKLPEEHSKPPSKKRGRKKKSDVIMATSSEHSYSSSPKDKFKIFMTEKIDRTPEVIDSPIQMMVDITSMFKVEPVQEIQLPIVEAPKKYLLSIDLKKDTDEEEEFLIEDKSDVQPSDLSKREKRSRHCKDKNQLKEDETESDPTPVSLPLSMTPIVLQKRDLDEKIDINPAPLKVQKLTKRQNQLSKNKSPLQDINVLDLKLGPNSQYQLVQCETYESFEAQPYRIYFTFEVQMLMYIHSYLSKHEVIGLLGGMCYQSSSENAKYLVISKIYAAESCIESQTVRLKNCEISDEEQIKIQDQMDKDGVQKLAWYHSHPIFEVDPSIQDLVTHYSQQVNFDRQGLPFFGVIVGPYLQKQDVTETQLTVFNLRDDNKNLNVQRQALQNLKDRARQFKYKIIPKTKLKYSMYSDIKKMIKTSSLHKCDKPDLCSEWTKQRSKQKFTFKDKFMLSLKKVCESNYQLQDKFDLISEIRDKLNQSDQNTLDQQLSSNDVVAPFQIIQRQQLQLQAGDQHQALLQKHQKTKYFSIGDGKKISKYLTKIEQALIKEFGLETQNLMEQTYLDQKQQEIEQQEKMQKMKNDEKVIQIQELRSRQIKKYQGEHQQMQGQGMQKINQSQSSPKRFQEDNGDEEQNEPNDHVSLNRF